MGSFDGVAEAYERGRRSHPDELRDHLVDVGLLTTTSTVIDLGAGTGQLSRLLAPVAAELIAVEPETDMIEVGRRVTADLGNVRWEQGHDVELPRLASPGAVDLVVIGNAFHHMDQARLLRDLDRLVTEGGGVCVATSSIPAWLQDRDWSRALRSVLEVEFGPLGGAGVPDDDDTGSVLGESAFADVSTWSHRYADSRTCRQVLDEIVSSASGRLSAATIDRLRAAIEPFVRHSSLPETVLATATIARRPEG